MPFPGQTYQIQNIEAFDIYYIDCTKYLHTPYLILICAVAVTHSHSSSLKCRESSKPKTETAACIPGLKLSQAVQKGECCRE
jgi:hypothetical protein